MTVLTSESEQDEMSNTTRCYECDVPATGQTFDGIPTCDNCSEDAHVSRGRQQSQQYRDTRGMDRFYGGQEPPFAVNDEFARTGSIADY